MEDGNHDELMRRNGLYAKMYRFKRNGTLEQGHTSGLIETAPNGPINRQSMLSQKPGGVQAGKTRKWDTWPVCVRIS